MVVLVVVVVAPRWIHLKGKHDIARVAQTWGVPMTVKTDADVSDLQSRPRCLLVQHVSTNEPPITGKQ
jgi:hypothetical protein